MDRRAWHATVHGVSELGTTEHTHHSSMFNFFFNFHTVCHNGCTIYSPTKCARFAFSPHPCQHLLFVFFFDDSQSDPYEEISDCGFDLHFPEDS